MIPPTNSVSYAPLRYAGGDRGPYDTNRPVSVTIIGEYFAPGGVFKWVMAWPGCLNIPFDSICQHGLQHEIYVVLRVIMTGQLLNVKPSRAGACFTMPNLVIISAAQMQCLWIWEQSRARCLPCVGYARVLACCLKIVYPGHSCVQQECWQPHEMSLKIWKLWELRRPAEWREEHTEEAKFESLEIF